MTHDIVLAGEVPGGAVVERLLPPGANGVAALDPSFNPTGGTPGVVTSRSTSRPSFNVRPRGCTVLGDRSIFVAGPDGSAPSRLAMGMVSADGDPSGFTFCCRAGVVTPTGDNWEGGSIEWNSSQTINPNLIVMGSVSHNAVLYAVDPCTSAGDANVNGNGFLSVPAIDGHTYSDPIVGAVQGDGSILLALLASDSLKADLVGWSYPVMPNAWQTPTAPGMITVPAGVALGGGSQPAPLRQADGTILIDAETATNQQVLFALKGDPGLGFTVWAPRGIQLRHGCGREATERGERYTGRGNHDPHESPPHGGHGHSAVEQHGPLRPRDQREPGGGYRGVSRRHCGFPSDVDGKRQRWQQWQQWWRR